MNEVGTRNQTPQIVRYTGPPARRATAAPTGGGLTGKDLWRIIRKRKWLIILPTVFFTIVAAIGTFLWLQYMPFYTALAFLAVNPPSEGPMQRGVGMYSTDIVERLVLTQAQMVKRETVLRKAVAMEEVQRTQWFKKDPGTAVQRLAKALNVSPVPTTNLIKVSVTGTDPKEVPELATAVCKAFVADTRDTAIQSNQDALKSLSDEETSFRASLSQLRTEKARIQRSTPTPELVARGSVQSDKLKILSTQLTQLQLMMAEAEAALESMKQQEAAGEMQNAPEIVQAIELDSRLRALRQSEMNMSVQLENALRKYGREHRQVKNLETVLGSTRRRISVREEELIKSEVKKLRELRIGRRAIFIAQLTMVKEEYIKTSASVRDIEVAVIRIKELESEERALQKEIQRIQSRQTEMRLATRFQQQVYLKSAAETPKEPSMPKWSIMIPAGIMLGLALGMGFAFLLEFVDTSIKSPADVARRIDLPILGMVPHIEDLDEEIEDVRKAFATNPSSLISEAFRQIRTCLQFSAPVEHRRSILVTSSLPEDGRTSVTMNLAASIAHGGHKVLVIDTNFRQPVASKLFVEAEESLEGLSSVLVAQANWRDVIHEIEPTLHIIPTGHLPPNPAELLGSDQMRQLLSEALNEYDQVLLDSAPCLVVTDASILSTIVDGVVLVVRAGANTHGVVQRTKDMLGRIGVHILGVVVNGVRVTVGGYLRENYEAFYEYQEQAKARLPIG